MAFVLAARYAHNRNTSAPFAVVEAIKENWDKLSEVTQKKIKKEAETEAQYCFEDWDKLKEL